MTVYFANPGKLDLDFIRVSGVSVKETETPIGYYGTGLKYGLATLLRTGHDIIIRIGATNYYVNKREQTMRGQLVERVYIDDEPMPFTTNLGRNWQVWQAYRELHSNTLDEKGTITDIPVHDDTVIMVSGPAIDVEFANRSQIFLNSAPIAANDRLEVHDKPSRFVYYRGVRAGQLPEEARFTYNILQTMELSEDRNFANLWNVEYAIETNVPSMPSTHVASEVLATTETWDGSLSFSLCGSPSEEFLNAAETHSSNANANPSVQAMLNNHRQQKGSFPACRLSDAQSQQVIDAVELLKKLNCHVELADVTVCESLGASIYGLYHRQQDRIFLSTEALDIGLEFTASTLYEEWLHKEHKLHDRSREMQDFLLNKLISLIKT